MSTSDTLSSTPGASVALPPSLPLENGDVLSREEFEQRYDAMPSVNKAELIEGVVHVASAVRWRKHGFPHSSLITWLGMYYAHTPGVEAGGNCSIRLDLENMPQPDATLIVAPSNGGRVRIGDDDLVVGAPELVAEVASSSAGIDLHQKLRVYRRNQVREYLVWRVLDRQIDWFALRGSQFDPLSAEPDGVFRSKAFPGLWLDAQALVDGDLRRVLEVLQRGIAAPEHAAFVEQLRQANKP